MFQKKNHGREDSFFICKNCGEYIKMKNMERHVKEDHFWNDSWDYFHN